METPGYFAIMQRRRFVQISAVAALGGVGAWVVGRPDGGLPAGDGALLPRFVVAPGEDPSHLPLAIGDAQLVEIDRAGALIVHSGPRVTRQNPPHAYQEIDGRRHDVTVRFDLAPTGEPRLVVGPYDQRSPLVIEPQPGKDAPQP